MKGEELGQKLEAFIREAIQDEIRQIFKQRNIIVTEQELFNIISEWMYYRHQYSDLQEYVKKVMDGYK